MKRALPILTLILLVSIPVFAERVTSETAKKVAQTFLSNNGAKATQMNDLSQAAGFQNLYIFTAEEGFVVMSADDCVKPILGYSLTGSFKTEGMPENISSWLQGYDDEIQFAIDHQVKANSDISQQWKDLKSGNPNAGKATTVVEPLLQTQWNQGDPYDMYCPSGTVTGCVATAMAQVMNYWQYPIHGIGSHSYIPENNPALGEQFADFNSTNYDWANMTNTYSSSSTTAEKQAVATLMYHCGVSVEMEYGPSSTGGSGAATSDVALSLKTCFNYSSDIQYLDREDYTDDEWIGMLKADLNQNRPIQYSGTGPGGGHSFVCDGYNSSNDFHFNWGWGGLCDAYYSISDLNPGPGGIGSGSYGVYNNYQGAVFSVHPSSCTMAAPTLSITQSERNVTLTWTTVSGAVSYNVYRNNSLIGNTTTTTFDDIAPYGNSSYYVRSVDSYDELSLSSNAAIATVDYQIPNVDDLTATFSGNNASLTWSAPEWCYPQSESSILTYGDGSSGHFLGFQGAQHMYWGHRYLPSDLSGAYNKTIFRVSFYVREPGNYKLYIYKGTHSNGSYDLPTTQLLEKSFTTSHLGWFSINLDAPVTIDTSQDLWILLYDPEYKYMPAENCEYNDHTKGSYYSTNISSWTSTAGNLAFLIRTYLTDGTYTYNLYNDGVKIAENITGTSYSDVTLNNNAANQLIVKTNYYGGEAPSNMVGYAKGYATTASLEMGENDMMTVTENATLTVTGTASNDNAEHLVIENGAQLAHNSDGVKATVKKNIEGYSGEDGWYFITSPVAEATTPSAANGFLNGSIGSNTYDLYYYNEPSYLWMNYEAGAFNIEHKKGYLYANGEASGTTLTFAGTLTPSNSAVASNTLSYTADHLKGFNLIGNPFACNVTVDKDFYVIDNTTHEVVLAGAGTQIAPCEGVFVQASAAGQTATFSKDTSKERGANASMDFTISQGQRTLDRARVRFGEGETLEKFSLNNQGCQLSFSQNNLEYAVICTEQASEIPVNFKVTQNGTYTLNVEANALETAYLHLIDNLTGADIDLLANPTYTFEANASDYASRFRLVFAANSDTEDNEWFAYYADGRIVVPNMNSDETLQIIDITGRMVQNNNLSNGVYVLRLVSGNDVKTQKIVIK